MEWFRSRFLFCLLSALGLASGSALRVVARPLLSVFVALDSLVFLCVVARPRLSVFVEGDSLFFLCSCLSVFVVVASVAYLPDS